MSSPAKRRKIDKDTSLSKPSRSLDFFFGSKNAASTQSAVQQREAPVTNEEGQDLTDEQLARKLQQEWDREDGAGSAPKHDSLSNNHSLESQSSEQNETYRGEECWEAEANPKDQPAQPLSSTSAFSNTLSLQSASATEDTITSTVNFDQSPLTFNPGEYIPKLKEQWTQEGGRATYALLTHCFVLVTQTQSRIRIVDNLVNLLRTIIEADPASLLPAVWLVTNSIAPPYVDLELGLGGSAISKALKKVCGLDSSGLKTLYNKHGDAGDVAFEAKKRQSLTLRKPQPLSIQGVYESLVKIANSKGHGSQEVKQRIVEKLVQDARGAEESRYIVRTLVQHLRIGAVKMTMLIALSRAFLLSRPPGASFQVRDRDQLRTLKKDQLAEVWSPSEETVKACFARRPNYNDLVPTLLEIGVCEELLVRCGLGLHIPLRPMLGNITRDLSDMLTKLQGRDFSCEFKYDGQRAQVHCDANGKVSIFSRHLEVMTEKYPDLVALVPQIRGEGVSSFIIEGEVVAVDHETGELKTFQTLTNRARKDVDIGSIKVGVCLFAFDLMYLNGEEMLGRSFRDRRELLRNLFVQIPNKFTWVKSIDATSNDSETVLEFFKSATDIKCEGIMVKVMDNLEISETSKSQFTSGNDGFTDLPAAPSTPSKSKSRKPAGAKGGKAHKDAKDADVEDKKGARRKALLATYEPDKRSDSWLKVKKDYAASSDTLDLVPIGGWHGQGRKNAWWSPILLAARNPETGCLEAVTKCISGFTDTFYKANKEKYADGSDNVIPRPSYVEYAGEPDVWFEPQEVWEIQYADITLSPTYTAAIGLVSEERGLSTRFPRFLKVREDKSIEEATTSDYLAGLWRQQEERRPLTNGTMPSVEADVDGDDG
ncbi:MAG: hypothetical protein Q9162_001835 [Coniocarpon cinnabarinum]